MNRFRQMKGNVNRQMKGNVSYCSATNFIKK